MRVRNRYFYVIVKRNNDLNMSSLSIKNLPILPWPEASYHLKMFSPVHSHVSVRMDHCILLSLLTLLRS